MTLGVHPVNSDLPGGAAAIAPMLDRAMLEAYTTLGYLAAHTDTVATTKEAPSSLRILPARQPSASTRSTSCRCPPTPSPSSTTVGRHLVPRHTGSRLSASDSRGG